MNIKSIVSKYAFAPIMIAAVVTFSGCKKDAFQQNADKGSFSRAKSAFVDSRVLPTVVATLPNVISATRTLHADTVWLINGPTYVTNGATLNIKPGTFIKGLKKSNPNNTKQQPSYLLVTKGSKINAAGTIDSTIVFTSEATAGNRRAGDWGGVVLLGNGITNTGLRNIEGIAPEYVTDAGLTYPDAIQYGTNVSEEDAAGASTITYTRIEYAGAVLEADNELNGLTLGGVGSATTLNHIQVSYGADDAFEFFGGSVNAKYLIAFGNNDDDLDADQGYQGTIQFAVLAKDPTVIPVSPATVYSANPNGLEINNISSPASIGGSFSTRKTDPVFSNITVLGEDVSRGPITGSTYGRGVLFRVNANFTFINSLVGGFDIGSEVITGASGTSGNNNIQAFTTIGSLGTGIASTSNANLYLLLANPFDIAFTGSANLPDFRFTASSPAASGTFVSATVPHTGGGVSSLTSTSYKGAFDSDSVIGWDENWASYNVNANPY